MYKNHILKYALNLNGWSPSQSDISAICASISNDEQVTAFRFSNKLDCLRSLVCKCLTRIMSVKLLKSMKECTADEATISNNLRIVCKPNQKTTVFSEYLKIQVYHLCELCNIVY
ncbi:hypothetical protein GJ496_000127 [Pomphorhynchus laevis]|nr:hypothetical protein GJ496_000127 [Pomphorhynchus laevis]